MHDGDVRCAATDGSRSRTRFVQLMSLMIVLGACTSAVSPGSSSQSVTSSAHPTQPQISPRPNPVDTTTLVWTQGGLPQGFAEHVARMPEVTHAVTVVAGTVWLTSSRSASGHVVDHPPTGYAIPLNLAGARPQDLVPFVPAQDRRLVGNLRAGGAILGATSARLRGLGRGGTLVFGDHRVRVAGVLPDRVVGGHEVFRLSSDGGKGSASRPSSTCCARHRRGSARSSSDGSSRPTRCSGSGLPARLTSSARPTRCSRR